MTYMRAVQISTENRCCASDKELHAYFLAIFSALDNFFFPLDNFTLKQRSTDHGGPQISDFLIERRIRNHFINAPPKNPENKTLTHTVDTYVDHLDAKKTIHSNFSV